MPTPDDVALGRLAIERGLVSADAIRALYRQLPPGRSLAQELVARGLLTPDQARGLVGAPASGRFPPAGPADQAPLIGAGVDDATVMSTRGSGSGRHPSESSSGSGRWGGGQLPQPGAVVGGRYAIESVLGKGGMGAVYAATDQQSGARVAVKLMLPEALGVAGAADRFRREAEAVAKVDAHAGIVRIHDFGTHAGMPYAAATLIEGGDLKARIAASDGLPLEDALAFAEGVARAIAHCHEQGVLHRDLKPANVLVRGSDNATFVTDFGLALDAAEAERLTQTGDVLGTPAYMSPEQADGDKAEVDHLTDVYALGAILYESISGRPPFSGAPLQIMRKIFVEPPPPLAKHKPGASAQANAICQQAMAKDKAARYASAAEFADDVARLRRGDPIHAKPPSFAKRAAWLVLKRRHPAAVALALLAVFGPMVLSVGAVVLWRAFSPQAVAESAVSGQFAELPGFLSAPLELDDGERYAIAAKTLDVKLNALRAVHSSTTSAASSETLLVRLDGLIERLAADAPSRDPAERYLKEVAGSRGIVTLRTLLRRAGALTGGGWRGGGSPVRPGQDPPLATLRSAANCGACARCEACTDAREEYRLLSALVLLDWELPTPATVTPISDELTEEASALLKVAGRLRKIPRERLQELSTQIRALESGARALPAWVWALNAPPEFSELDAFTQGRLDESNPLRAHVAGRLVEAKQRLLAEAVAALLDNVEKKPLNQMTREVTRKLKVALNELTDLAEAAPATSTESRESIARARTELMKRICRRTIDHMKERSADVEILTAWTELMQDGLPDDEPDEELIALILDVGIVYLQRTLESGKVPAFHILLSFPLIRQNPVKNFTERAFATYLKEGAFEKQLKQDQGKWNCGNTYFVWGEAVGRAWGRDRLYSQEGRKAHAELYAQALGDSLGQAEREALQVVDAKVALSAPLSPWWVDFCRWRLYRISAGRFAARAGEQVSDADLTGWNAMLAGYEDLVTRPESFPEVLDSLRIRLEQADFVNQTRDIRARHGSLSDAEDHALWRQSAELLKAAEPRAWKIYELVRDGSPEAMKTLGVRSASLLGSQGALDQKRNLTAIERVVRERGYLLREEFKHSDQAIELYERTFARMRSLDAVPPLALRVDHAWAHLECERIEDAERLAQAVAADARATLDSLVPQPSRYEKALHLLVALRLRAGDAAGARALVKTSLTLPGGRSYEADWVQIEEELGELERKQ